MKMYIAVLDEVPDFMVPTLVAHTVLGAHMHFMETRPNLGGLIQIPKHRRYRTWLKDSFKKVVVRVNQKEFDKIAALEDTYLGHENTTLDGRKSCAIPVIFTAEMLPNVLKYAKMWKPKDAQD